MAVTQAKQFQRTPGAAAPPIKVRSLWVDAWLRLRRNKVAVVSVGILFVLAVIAVLYPILEPDSYRQIVRDPVTHRVIQNQPPSPQHWFGTDRPATSFVRMAAM